MSFQAMRYRWVLMLVPISLGLMLAAPRPAQAQFLRLIPERCAKQMPDGAGGYQDCDFNDVLQTIINFMQLMLGISGSLALLAFTYGGIQFIIASGKPEEINKGKEALKAASIGLIVVFSSWLIVNLVISTLSKGEVSGGTIFGRPWYIVGAAAKSTPK